MIVRIKKILYCSCSLQKLRSKTNKRTIAHQWFFRFISREDIEDSNEIEDETVEDCYLDSDYDFAEDYGLDDDDNF